MSNKGATNEINHIMDAASSNTAKSIMAEDVQTIKPVNAKQDFTKAELLKLLSYMEGELQARDIVIAVLKVSFFGVLLGNLRKNCIEFWFLISRTHLRFPRNFRELVESGRSRIHSFILLILLILANVTKIIKI